ncbi:MAG TPA: zf-HC2 domain-containing protein [Terriglobales bacterium]|nr:zf-HC2 domain-containing protein [Terriglobales bacterium]
MKCTKVKSLLSWHLDGNLEIQDRRALTEHLGSCTDCHTALLELKQLKMLVHSVGHQPAPPDLALKIRLAISREAARVRTSPLENLCFRVQTAMRAFMVPATAGILSAIVFFGLLIGFFVMPSQTNDVPTMLYTPPELAVAPFGLTDDINASSIVVEAYIDANGRVQDYRVLSAPHDANVVDSDLKNILIFTVFKPATSFGRPTTGRAVLTFSNVNVRG